MAELTSWHDLPRAGIADPAVAPRTLTGDWRTVGRPVPELSQCVNCLLCWLYCPDSAVLLDDATFAGIDYDLCKGCELCVAVCPVDALSMEPEATS